MAIWISTRLALSLQFQRLALFSAGLGRLRFAILQLVVGLSVPIFCGGGVKLKIQRKSTLGIDRWSGILRGYCREPIRDK